MKPCFEIQGPLLTCYSLLCNKPVVRVCNKIADDQAGTCIHSNAGRWHAMYNRQPLEKIYPRSAHHTPRRNAAQSVNIIIRSPNEKRLLSKSKILFKNINTTKIKIYTNKCKTMLIKHFFYSFVSFDIHSYTKLIFKLLEYIISS